jgi:chromosome partitioning protein
MVQRQDLPKVNPPFVIALCQEKGGVGKTTTAVCLGTGLAQKGKRVLMLDLAANGNLTSAFGIHLSRVQRSTADLFRGTFHPESIIQPTSIRNLDLIPSNASIRSLTKELYQKKNYERFLGKRLSTGDFPAYDIILLDCSSGMTPLTLNAITAANLVIFPLVCEYFALQTLDNMIRLFRLAQSRNKPTLAYRLLVTKLDHRAALHKRVLAQIEEHYRQVLLETVIGVDIKLPESQLAGLPILTYDPKSRASQQYQSLTSEILALIETIKSTVKSEDFS